MNRKWTDKFGGDLRRVQRNRQHRKQQRELERAYGDKSSVEEMLENLKDEWEFSSQEIDAIERQAGRHVGWAGKSAGRELLNQGLDSRRSCLPHW